jgi:two-component system response regulator RegA
MLEAVLLVDDSDYVIDSVSRLLRREGCAVETARTVSAAKDLMATHTFQHCILDLVLADGLAIVLVEPLLASRTRVIIHSGYLTIRLTWHAARAWKVAEILPKPSGPSEIIAAVRGKSHETASFDSRSLEYKRTLAQLEREYIDQTLMELGGNITQTARALGLHRQSLQRKLRKH